MAFFVHSGILVGWCLTLKKIRENSIIFIIAFIILIFNMFTIYGVYLFSIDQWVFMNLDSTGIFFTDKNILFSASLSMFKKNFSTSKQCLVKKGVDKSTLNPHPTDDDIENLRQNFLEKSDKIYPIV